MATKENVLTKMDDFMIWFLPKIEKFPRNYKFLFGDRLIHIQLNLMEHLIEAYYQKNKLPTLRAANLEIEKLRHLMQICTKLKFISVDQLEFATRALNDLGGMDCVQEVQCIAQGRLKRGHGMNLLNANLIC